ncbi:hypothetical protein FKM82_026344 [Ascaphus truei]
MYAKVKKSLPEMYAFTVCMWLKSNASPGVGTPFSYAVPGQANELVLIEWGNNPMEILINDKVAKLPFVINDGKWHHICIAWTTRDGVWEAYQDGMLRGNGENLAPYHPIKHQGVLVLGQEQVRCNPSLEGHIVVLQKPFGSKGKGTCQGHISSFSNNPSGLKGGFGLHGSERG